MPLGCLAHVSPANSFVQQILTQDLLNARHRELNQTESAHTEHSLLEEIELATNNYKAVKLVIMRYTQRALEAHTKKVIP